jgi:hypothetical protein
MAAPILTSMRAIELTRGQVVIVDDQDFLELAQYRWCYSTVGYAVRRKKMPDGKSKVVYMHREIMNPEKGMEVDHVNGQKLDCRRDNLRLCTSGQNKYNIGKKRDNTSGYKGVWYSKQKQRWVSEIWVEKKKRYLGSFNTPEDAAIAYNAAAIRFHGDFSNIN